MAVGISSSLLTHDMQSQLLSPPGHPGSDLGSVVLRMNNGIPQKIQGIQEVQVIQEMIIL